MTTGMAAKAATRAQLRRGPAWSTPKPTMTGATNCATETTRVKCAKLRTRVSGVESRPTVFCSDTLKKAKATPFSSAATKRAGRVGESAGTRMPAMLPTMPTVSGQRVP